MTTCTAVYIALAVAHWWLWPQAVFHVAADAPMIVKTLATYQFSVDCDRRYVLQVRLGERDLGLHSESLYQEQRRIMDRELYRMASGAQTREEMKARLVPILEDWCRRGEQSSCLVDRP